MADNIVDSLFGPQPWQVQQQQNESMRAEAERIARMDGFQQAKYGIGRGAGMLAGAGMEAAGYQNPAVAQAQMNEQNMAGLDPSDPKSLLLRASQIQDPRMKWKLIMAAKAQQAAAQKEQLEANKDARQQSHEEFIQKEAYALRKLQAEATIRQNDERIADARTSKAESAALQRQNNEIKLMLGQGMLAMKQSQAEAKGPKLTKGQEAVDRTFGKEYADYQAGGGSADVEKQLRQLDQVATDLKKPGNDYTGPMVGLIPEKARAFTNQAAVDAKNKVEEVAQRNLRLVLGAQFTQVEGERLIARAYNPSLDPSVNAARVKALADQIRTAAKAKEDAARYFEENGTLTGWKGRIPTLSDFESAVDNADPKQSASGKIAPKGKSALDAALEKY